MGDPKPPVNPRYLLGIEGGGTRTVALVTTRHLELVRRLEAPPGNLQLLSDPELLQLLIGLNVSASHLDAIAVGLPGARTVADRQRVLRAAGQAWPGVPCHATNDLETALAAATLANTKHSPAPAVARVLVLSGTGSCCYGAHPNGKTARTGGWGHLLGDRGSAYDVSIRALRATLNTYDRTGRWPKLGQRLLRKTLINNPNELVPWTQHATKTQIAGLAVEVLHAAQRADPIAKPVIHDAACALADNALACARQLIRPTTRGVALEFVLSGGMLRPSCSFARILKRHLRKARPHATITHLETEGAWGAVMLASRLATRTGARPHTPVKRSSPDPLPPSNHSTSTHTLASIPLTLDQLQQSPTEQRHPRSHNLHRLSFRAAIRLFLSEDATIPGALLREARAIERACMLVSQALRTGHHLFYVGAGTSGRLGVLDAVECPPTFRTPPDLVQAILAGGPRALWESAEGAEDDPAAGAMAIQARGVSRGDIALGIAASGRTPFVWGALQAAHQRAATTILLCFNPALKNHRSTQLDLVIAPDLGPELLTGSTRLKAGTATKLVLNLVSTLAMVRLGKVTSNLMIDLHPTNSKLRDRAIRIVRQLANLGESEARHALERSGWSIQDALRHASSL
jgi:N-acetylmuramic acid 6-phosphate etherase